MPELGLLASAFIMGLVGSGHCFGMCGGIGSALGMLNQEAGGQTLLRLVGFNVGRISSYALAGLVLGTLSFSVGAIAPEAKLALRIFAGVMLIMMAAYVGRWWMGLTKLEQIGAKLWNIVNPVARQMLPIDTFPKAIAVGLLWGWLPCGLVYSALAWSAGAMDPAWSALLMLCFGLGTVPMMFGASFFAQGISTFLNKAWVRHCLALFLLVFAFWGIFNAIQHSQQGHAGHGQMQKPAAEQMEHRHH